MSRLTLIFILLLFGAIGAAKISAVTLDWDTVTWTPGALTNSYDIDPARAGNDATFTISGNTNRLRTNLGGVLTPAITNAFAGGMSPTQNSLQLAIDLSSNAESVTVTLDFSALYAAGIYHLSFTLFDVDYANSPGSGSTYQDQISNIHGTTGGGTQVAPTVTTSAGNSLIGSGLTQMVRGTAAVADTGAGSGNGNVTFDFNDTAIKSFTFTYGSSGLFANPTYQHVGFWDFTYSPVPEINPAWSAILSCLGAGGLVLRHRAKFRN
jgi:hypothetical protein